MPAKNVESAIAWLCSYYDKCQAEGVTPNAKVLKEFDKMFDYLQG